MALHNMLGKRGEDAACALLRRRRYRVIERNARTKWSELDVVARKWRRGLIFVEVKSRCADTIGTPEAAFTRDKLYRLARAAEAYAAFHAYAGLYHIDAVCVTFEPDARTVLRVKHYMDII